MQEGAALRCRHTSPLAHTAAGPSSLLASSRRAPTASQPASQPLRQPAAPTRSLPGSRPQAHTTHAPPPTHPPTSGSFLYRWAWSIWPRPPLQGRKGGVGWGAGRQARAQAGSEGGQAGQGDGQAGRRAAAALAQGSGGRVSREGAPGTASRSLGTGPHISTATRFVPPTLAAARHHLDNRLPPAAAHLNMMGLIHSRRSPPASRCPKVRV